MPDETGMLLEYVWQESSAHLPLSSLWAYVDPDTHTEIADGIRYELTQG